MNVANKTVKNPVLRHSKRYVTRPTKHIDISAASKVQASSTCFQFVCSMTTMTTSACYGWQRVTESFKCLFGMNSLSIRVQFSRAITVFFVVLVSRFRFELYFGRFTLFTQLFSGCDFVETLLRSISNNLQYYCRADSFLAFLHFLNRDYSVKIVLFILRCTFCGIFLRILLRLNNVVEAKLAKLVNRKAHKRQLQDFALHVVHEKKFICL